MKESQKKDGSISQLSAAEIAAKRIREMPLSKDYKPVDDLPIPLHRGVLVLKYTRKHNPLLTAGGIELVEGENTNEGKHGIIMAVGPNCSEFLRVGLRCQFNFYVDSLFWHKGETYYKMDEPDVYYIVPSSETVVDNGVKKASAVRHEKKFQEQKSYLEHEAKKDANDKDKRMDKTKGKIRKVK